MASKNGIDDYLDYISIDLGLTKATLETYKTQLISFLKFLRGKNINFEAFTEDNIREYIREITKDRDLSSTSVNLVLSAIKSFVKYQTIEGIRRDNPFANYDYPKLGHHIPKILSTDAMKKILHEPNEDIYLELRDKTLMTMLYATGLRSQELISLKFSNIYFIEERLRVVGKGQKERMVPIAGVALTLLKKYIEKSKENGVVFKGQYLFPSEKTDTHISRQTLFLRIKFYAKRAGLNPLPSAHVFRHAFATHLLDNDADLSTVQQLLGHSSLNTTEIYTHVVSKRIHEVYNKSHPRS